MNLLLSVPVLMAIVMAASASDVMGQPADLLAPFRAERDAFVQTYRVTGRIDRQRISPVVARLAALAQSSHGETHARALLELGTLQRMLNDFQTAIATMSAAAQSASALGLRDVAFEAWVGVARAYQYGTSDHGAAAVAFERAVDAAGEQPTVKQQADLADYRSQLELGRGETEAGLIDALRALSLATEPKDRFYAELGLADGLQKLAESCDYRPLIDAKSSEDGADTYAACRRAVAAARTVYQRCAETAAALGWEYLVNQMRQFQRGLDVRGVLIDQYAKRQAYNQVPAFHPRKPSEVLVTSQFESGASALTDAPALANLVDSVLAEASAANGRPDARSLYMLGLTKDIRGTGPDAAVEFFAAAAKLLGEERRSFFDPSRRGTVTENRAEIVRDLALRLLTLRRESDAFAAFESIRTRGLEELASVLARPDVTADDRVWLAGLLVVEARSAALEKSLVANIVATGQIDASTADLQALDALRADFRTRLRANDAARARFAAGVTAPPASLDALRAAAAGAGIPVLLYWSTNTNVIAWYVGPDGSVVRNVFLPAQVLEDRIGRVLASSGGSLGREPFDETAARELFLFLLAPFAAELSTVSQIMIVPQGPLVQLPFEPLIDPASGKPIIERWAVSYAPNATMAVAALRSEPRPIHTVAALVDQNIDDYTKETAAIQASGVQLSPVTRNGLFSAAWQADSLHVLTHGEFDPTEALLSRLAATRPGDPPILAADLVALPLRDLRLAVLSACKGGRVGTRISGEIYGFPWALLAGGTAATVLSRWDVNGDSNGRWMGAFYRELVRGASPALAAATAMREMRRAGSVHPYYWAAMQVIGR